MPGACVREEHSESFSMAMLDTRVNGGEDIRAGSESRAALGGKPQPLLPLRAPGRFGRHAEVLSVHSRV